jgi:4-amino-4-deoxy-L-arabinose transferase-like glycosyltransferase
MSRQLRSISIVALIVVLSGFLYGHRLEYAPPHVEIDEVLIALDAHALASTGRDLRGELLPLYSQTAEHSWYQPFVIYLTTLVLTVLPLSEWAIRLPTVGIGILNIALIYFVGRQLFESDWFGISAAVLLALTPAHFIHSRYGMDDIYPLPFILAWLLCLVSYSRRPRPWLLVAGTATLGIGFYSYIASMVMMPVYFLLTCLMLFWQKAPRRRYWLAAAGFFPMLVPFLVWLARHPTAYAATIVKYGLYDVNQLNAVQGLRSFFGYMSVTQRISQYWSFFNPAFLFFGGGAPLMFSTNLVGVFALPLAVLLPLGVYFALKHFATPIHLIVCVGFATAPCAALIVAEQDAIFRALPILPFGVLLATLGLYCLWSRSINKPRFPIHKPIAIAILAAGSAYAAWTLITQSRLTRSSSPLALVGLGAFIVTSVRDQTRQWRIVAVCLLALAPLQFSQFWSDYFSDYRVRSAYWLGGNIRGALEEIIDRDRHEHIPMVYFSTLKATSGQVDGRNQYMDAYWRFYLIKHGRQDLLARTRPLEATDPRTLQAGSLVLANVGDVTTETLVHSGDLKQVKAVAELNGTVFFVILRR